MIVLKILILVIKRVSFFIKFRIFICLRKDIRFDFFLLFVRFVIAIYDTLFSLFEMYFLNKFGSLGKSWEHMMNIYDLQGLK